MENLAANNNSQNMTASSRQNMFSTVNSGPQIPQGGQMTSLLHPTEELNRTGVGSNSAQISLSFTELIHEQHSFLHGGRLVVELNNIEGPRGANNIGPSGVRAPTAVNDPISQGGQRCVCGRRKKGPETEGTSIDVDLNEIPTDTGEDFCGCENPAVQGTESMNPHVGSSSHGHTAEQQSQSSLGSSQTEIGVATASRDVEDSNRGGRSRRSITRVSPRRVTTYVSGDPSGETPILEPVTIPAVHVTAPMNIAMSALADEATSFRIRDIVARRDAMLRALIHSQTFAPAPRTTQLSEQFYHQPTAETFISDLNQGQFVGPMMQSRSGADRRDPRFNVQSIGNILTDADSNLQMEILRRIQRATMELVELGERIIGVNTAGLTEEVIMERLVRYHYGESTNRPPEDAESCCICLVDFESNDALGRINCTHKLHFDCIKQWLKEKNFCPMCKQTALPQN